MPNPARPAAPENDRAPQLGLFAGHGWEQPRAAGGGHAQQAADPEPSPTPEPQAQPESESRAGSQANSLPRPLSAAPGRSRKRLRSSGVDAALPAWAYAAMKPADPAPPTPRNDAGPSRQAQTDDDPVFDPALLADEEYDEPEPQPEARRIWTVADLVCQVRAHVEQRWPDLWVHGEISNLRSAPSGHLYFTLKDGESQLPAVLFRRQAQLLRFRPEDGIEVLLRGKLSVYEQRGQMQLIAEYLEPVGAGSLQIAFEQLKARLAAEGLFDAERKRELPPYPRCVGIVTSPTGAVIRDFLNVAGRRHAALDVLLYPAAVQGGSAAAEVAAGIVYFNAARNVDVIVIARGGGSLEDLAPFNTELLARAIATSELPVVSAIGHETDFTIADFVADLRAPTPSAAAELITAAQHRVEEQVAALEQRLHRGWRYRLMLARQHLGTLSMETARARLTESINRREQRVDALRFRLHNAHALRLRNARERLQATTARLLRQDASSRLEILRGRWNSLDARLTRVALEQFRAPRNKLLSLTRELENLSPLTVLSRGYALVFDAQGALVKRAADLSAGDLLTVRVAEGSTTARVTENTLEEA